MSTYRIPHSFLKQLLFLASFFVFALSLLSIGLSNPVHAGPCPFVTPEVPQCGDTAFTCMVPPDSIPYDINITNGTWLCVQCTSGNTTRGYNNSASCGPIITTGDISVSSNIAGASYTITGPVTLSGSGVSNSHANQPTGGYTITWNDVAGYTKPGSSSQTLSSGGTISFVGNYSGVAPTCSYTGPINWVEPTGLECSVGVSYNSVPVGGQRTATDSNASGNGYTGSYTAQCVGSNSWQYVSHVCNAPVVTTINLNFE